MYSISINEQDWQYELTKTTRSGREIIEASQNITAASPAFHLAYNNREKLPHLAGYFWRAAELVASSAANLAIETNWIGRSPSGHDRYAYAEVKSSNGEDSYIVYTIQRAEPAPSEPQQNQNHTYGCTCPHYQLGKGKRPLSSKGQPLCKHILAVCMVMAICGNMPKTKPPQRSRYLASEPMDEKEKALAAIVREKGRAKFTTCQLANDPEAMTRMQLMVKRQGATREQGF